jgi:hypothetical protein
MSLRGFLIGLGLVGGLAVGMAAQAQTTTLTALHDALHLTPAQEAAWSAYAAQMPTPAQARARHHAAAMLFPTLTAPRRIDLVEAEMQQDLADLRREGDALKAFYATLDSDQQHIFDAQTLPSSSQDEDQ